MNKRKSRLEDLPNELLTDIFKILDGQDLFQSFYNLNIRLNRLLETFGYLQLIYHMKSTNNFKTNNKIFPYYIHTLIIDPWIDINLEHFSNVRCLKLNVPSPNLLEKIKSNIMPYLTYLSISFEYNMYEIALLHKRIFSNHFIHLKSYEFQSKIDTLMTIPEYTQSSSINILKIGFIDPIVYTRILSCCPNLYFLKFSLVPSNGFLTNISIHNNLKRMIIELKDPEWIYDDNLISGYLSYVPNLEKLVIHRRNFTKNILEYLEHYDWLQSVINLHLSILKIFKFYFHLSQHPELKELINNTICIQIEKDFLNVHKDHYKAKLIID